MKPFGLERIFESVAMLRSVREATKVTRDEFVACDFDSIGIKSLSEIYRLGRHGITLELVFKEKQGALLDRKVRVVFVLSQDDDNSVNIVFTQIVDSGVWMCEQYRPGETDENIARRLIGEALRGVDIDLLPEGWMPVTGALGKIAKIADNVRNLR